MTAQLKLTNFRPFASQRGCPFMVQVQPLQVVSFGNFSYGTTLYYSICTQHILLFFVPRDLPSKPKN